MRGKLPESLPPERRQPLNARSVLHGYRTVLGSAQFVRVSLAHGLNWVAFSSMWQPVRIFW
jgi:DHA1 family bicyclomycin/chloramphenicol resistance-like MFS transporter